MNFLTTIFVVFISLTAGAADFKLEIPAKELARLGTDGRLAAAAVAEVSLPPKIKSGLPFKVEVFFDLVTASDIEPFQCGYNYVYTESQLSAARYRWQLGAKKYGPAVRMNHQTVESYISVRQGSYLNQIHVNSKFLAGLNGKNNISYDCEHHNLKELLKSNLINQLSRLYSMRSQFAAQDDYMVMNEFVKSGDNKGPASKSLRKYSPREFHPYANISDVHNHFAYAMEFFLLDPEFQCRKPALNTFLIQKLQFNPSLASSCTVNTQIRLVGTGDEIIKGDTDCPITKINGVCPVEGRYAYYYDKRDVDPKNVYGLQYVKSAPGQGMVSKFGHSAFRLQVCPEFSKTHDIAACEKMQIGSSASRRYANDLIFNYRANTMGLRINNFRGLTGSYPSQLFLSDVGDYMNEYAYDEIRNVYAFPIEFKEIARQSVSDISDQDLDSITSPKFSAEKLRRFVNFGLERFWTYVGNYNFLTRNCANEALDHVKVALDDAKLYGVGVMTPGGVDKKLGKRKYLDRDVIDQKELQKKVKTWAEFEKLHSEAGGNDYVFASVKYNVVNSMRFIMDNLNLPTDSPDKVLEFIKDWQEGYNFQLGKKVPRFVTVSEKIIADWQKDPEAMAYPAIAGQIERVKKAKDALQAKNSFANAKDYIAISLLTLIQKLYADYAPVGDSKNFNIITQHLFKVIKYAHRQVDRELNKQAMQVACSVINCDQAEDRARNSLNMNKIFEKPAMVVPDEDVAIYDKNPEKLKEILNTFAQDYYQFEEGKRPFRQYTVKAGYGIPLAQDVVDENDQDLKNINYYEQVILSNIYKVLQNRVGTIYGYEVALRVIRSELYDRMPKGRVRPDADPVE